MKRKMSMVLVACGITVALMLAACSQTAGPSSRGPTQTTKLAPITTTAPAAPTATTATSGKPQYGGTLTVAQTSLTSVFDTAASGQLDSGGNGAVINERLVGPDWTQGPDGSGKVDWAQPNQDMSTYAGVLAQSWATPSPGTFVLNIRQGVHWALDSSSPASQLMNGREMTADDVIENFDYMMHSPHTAIKGFEPVLAQTANMTKTGPWQVTLTVPPGQALDAWLWTVYGGGGYFQYPPDVIKKYGNMQDWHNVVGTGPYMLTDFVAASSETFTRNPNYWGTMLIGPGKGDQLPYVNQIDTLVIPDVSTEEAALRTAKIDLMQSVQTDDAKSLMQTTPDLSNHPYYTQVPLVIAMRTDKTNVPFHDVRVRQALMMATDFNGLSSNLYGGDAQIVWPVIPQVFKEYYVPTSQLPQPVQALYQYNPDEAKKLLAEAGYPNGFKTSMIVQDLSSDVDITSSIEAMWAKVGVDVTLQPMETGAYMAVTFSRNYSQTILTGSACFWDTTLILSHWWGNTFDNSSYVDTPAGTDPTIDAAHAQIQQYMFVDWTKADQVFRNLMPYVLGQAFYIPVPSPHSYNLWWPWVKYYDGEPQVNDFYKYYWVDQNIKSSMGK